MITQKKYQSGLTMLEVIIASVILSFVIALSSYMVYTSSQTVSESELGLQLEAQARQIVTQITNDLRQARSSSLRNFSNGTTPSILLATGMTGIEMRLPGPSFDGVNSSMSTSQQGTWLTGLKGNSDVYTTRMVEYFWDVDGAEGETLLNSPNQCADENKDGRVDEGVLRKVEWITDGNGNKITQNSPPSPVHSVICRDLMATNITALAVNQPYAALSTPNTQLTPCNWGLQFMVDDAVTPTKMTITLTLGKVDPKKKRSDPTHVITKQVQTTIELRN